MPSNFVIDHLIGISPWTCRLRRRVLQVARYRYGVLISGPAGTGKRLIARAIHAHSDRAGRPLVPVNCAAVRGRLFATQMFGHVRGALAGAQFEALGCLRAADGGTVFLDGVGELDRQCQDDLIRFLRHRAVVPVGGREAVPVDVRVVASTDRKLREEVTSGRFRLDLYYHLAALGIETVGLAERVEDIVPLARHFLARATVERGIPPKRLSRAAEAMLESHAWTGNVAELHEVIEAAVAFADDEVIRPSAFVPLAGDDTCLNDGLGDYPTEHVDGPQDIPTSADAPLVPQPGSDSQSGPTSVDEATHWPSLAEIEAEHIRRTLRQMLYDRRATARLLGIDRRLLDEKMRRYGIRPPSGTPWIWGRR